MIGNDIVDLNLAGVNSRWREQRFLDKLFTNREQSYITDFNGYSTTWRLWSMKESAYKIWARDKSSLFNPKSFECIIFSETIGSVAFDGQIANTTTTTKGDAIYTLAHLQKEAILNEVIVFDTNLRSDRTCLLKEKAISAYSDLKSISKETIRIEKNIFGAPHFLIHQKRQPNFLTLTHHGQFGGFAITC